MMTAPREVNEDGALQPALQALEDAIHLLVDPQEQYHDGKLFVGSSRYMQLWDAVKGESTNGGGAGGGSKSRPPFWVDAYDVLAEIDTGVECWQPAFTGVPPTVGRLRCILARGWRPQDVRNMGQITDAVTAWATSIEELLNPKPKWTLPYACPRCGVKTVYRRDSSGEMVRSATLQLSAEGCTCAKCRAHWQPGQFLFLGQLLGGEPPAGVVG